MNMDTQHYVNQNQGGMASVNFRTGGSNQNSYKNYEPAPDNNMPRLTRSESQRKKQEEQQTGTHRNNQSFNLI